MTAEANDATNAIESPGERRTRHRRHHRRTFYKVWIRPYRRELRTLLLLCGVVLATYYLWQMLAAS